MAPRQCHVPTTPAFPDVNFAPADVDEDGTPDFAVTTPPELAALAVWLEAMAEWHDAVLACPTVVEGPLGDLAEGI